MTLLNSLTNNIHKFTYPFDHWEFSSALTQEMINEVYNTEVDTSIELLESYDGTRASDKGAGEFRGGIALGGAAGKFRCYIEEDNYHKFPELYLLIQQMQDKKTYEHIGKLINKDLSNSYVRAEIICDREGFWLKPHCDIKEKLLSCLIFVNQNNESENLGTDLYDEALNKVKTVPYKNNLGFFFTSANNTWHGLEEKTIKQERRCIQLNYTTFETSWPANR